MLVLAIETSTPQTSVALGTEQGVIASATVSWGRGHGEVLAPAIERLQHWSEVRLAQIGGVAVGVGPGLFTGLRVGVSTARGLAHVLGVPVVPIGSLDALAFAARHARKRIGAVTDAKRGEVFYAFYRAVPGGVTRETEYVVGSPARLIAELEARAEDTLLVGGGALLYRRDLEDAGTGIELGTASTAFPSAEALLELAIPKFEREEAVRPEHVVPLYLRKSDAEIGWAKRARSA